MEKFSTFSFIKCIFFKSTTSPVKLSLAVGLSISLSSVVLNLFLPAYYGYLVNSVYQLNTPSTCLIFYASLVVFSNLMIQVKEFFLSYLVRHYISYLRYSAFSKILFKDFSFFYKLSPARVLHQLDRIDPMIESWIKTIVFYLFPTLIEVVFFSGIILYYCGFLCSLVVFFSFVIFLIYTAKSFPKTQRMAGLVHKQENNFVSSFGQSLTNIKDIKAFKTEPFQQKKAFQTLNSLKKIGIKSDFLSIRIKINQTLILGVSILSLLAIYSYNSSSSWSISGPIILMNYFITLTAPLSWLGTSLIDSRSSIESFREIKPYLSDQTFYLFEQPQIEHKVYGNLLLNTLSFQNIFFSYDSTRYVLKNLSFKAYKGQLTAIIGKNGVGKTTISHLILGLIKSKKGHIMFDKDDIDNLAPDYLRYLIGYVSQELEVLNTSFFNNITLNRPATSQEVFRAARISGFWQCIKKDNRYLHDTAGEKGTCLSGGQKQKLALARALLYDPPVLILDEPTNHLDKNSFTAMMEILGQLKQNKIILVMSHDERLIRKADQIINIEEII